MARKYLPIRGDGKEFRLRLTVRGQRELKRQFQEETLQTIFMAASDSERMCALLQEALNWPESGNTITDGEVFYDLLVDWGWHGQERFGELSFDLAAASGLMTEHQACQLKESLRAAVAQAFSQMGQSTEAEAEKEETGDPFPHR